MSRVPALHRPGQRPGIQDQARAWSRRRWLKAVALGGLLTPCSFGRSLGRDAVRHFHVCLSAPAIEQEPSLPRLIREAGVSTVWLGGFFYGHEPFPLDQLRAARRLLEAAGLEAQLVNVPLGHPGDSLGAKDGRFPLTPPEHWQTGLRPDGRRFCGTSLHAPAVTENVAALKRLRAAGFKRAFLDDDFRLARGPGEIGGCYCDAHRERFLRQTGYGPGRWEELLNDVRDRRLTSLLRRWLTFTCDELTAAFSAQQRAFLGDLGNMVMFLGAEKAGLRLADYREVPLRVGELMFSDAAFAPVKGKTDELFSVLFHRQFTSPARAYSETTTFPATGLSAEHLAAKLVISTVADVRNTMFMSGLTPFPIEYWSTLGPAMRTHAAIHQEVAGHKLRGPFKHFWGEAERSIGEDRPFSLWLALGVPFETVQAPSRDGWTFLSDYDARELALARDTAKTQLVCRHSATTRPDGAVTFNESLSDLFSFKRSLVDKLAAVPYVIEEEPALCAWYPTAERVLVWNLSPAPRRLTVLYKKRGYPMELGPLAATVATLRR